MAVEIIQKQLNIVVPSRKATSQNLLVYTIYIWCHYSWPSKRMYDEPILCLAQPHFVYKINILMLLVAHTGMFSLIAKTRYCNLLYKVHTETLTIIIFKWGNPGNA